MIILTNIARNESRKIDENGCIHEKIGDGEWTMRPNPLTCQGAIDGYVDFMTNALGYVIKGQPSNQFPQQDVPDELRAEPQAAIPVDQTNTKDHENNDAS